MDSRLNSRRSLRGDLEDSASNGISVNTEDLRNAFGDSETVLSTTFNDVRSFLLHRPIRMVLIIN